jgi:hypothetical protein
MGLGFVLAVCIWWLFKGEIEGFALDELGLGLSFQPAARLVFVSDIWGQGY